MEIRVTKLAAEDGAVYQVESEDGGFIELSKEDWERVLRVIREMDKKREASVEERVIG